MPLSKLLLLIASFLLIATQWSVHEAQVPPSERDGFMYTSHPLDSHTIFIDAFFDPVCPDSRDAWPPLKQAIQHYGSRVSLLIHLLPLPYHDNAFATSRALHIVNSFNKSATFTLMESFFKYQTRFYNAKTHNMSRAAVVDDIVKFASQAVGNSYSSLIQAAFNDRKTDLKTRVSFKYSGSRGVYGTPWFFVNGFSLPDAGDPIDYNAWRKVIDPLITAQGVKSQGALHYF
ncbi:hypothetical protein ACFE04_025607 [Oxalis oulophora]